MMDCFFLTAIQTIDTSDLLKKAHCNTEVVEIEKKVHDHDKCITTP